MHIVLGGTGNVGSKVADALLATGERVTVVTRDREQAEVLRRKGAAIAVADFADTKALRDIIAGGERLFVLNPPADPTSGDTDAAENRTIAAIMAALNGTTIERIVALSTYGAQRGAHLGDFGTLHRLEQMLSSLSVPVDIVRVAYLMSNWAAAVETARTEGMLHVMFPADFSLPMVAPDDIGPFAAGLMRQKAGGGTLHYFEGPTRYTPSDVARAFEKSLGRKVEVGTTPPEQLEEAFMAIGFAPEAARSYSGMTRATLAGEQPDPAQVSRGPTTLEDYIDRLVQDMH